MSLQVWLPLTKDTRNQGLVNIVSNNNGVTFTSGGKLGEKYFSAGTITIPASSSNSIFNGTHISFSFWLKPVGTSGTSVIFGQSNMSAGNNRMYSIFQYPTPNDLHISWQSETSSSTFIGFTISGFFEADKWTHCALVYDGSKLLVYKNGVLNGTYNGVNTRTAFNYDYPINASSIRCLNDFRVYNHCLSPMEVKELAKGLVLHYPLNHQGLGQENLFSWANNATSITLNDYQNVGSFTQFTNSLSFDPSTTVGKKYTISFWAKSPNGTTSLLLYNSNSKPQYFNFSTTLTNNLGTEWQFFKYTVTNTQYTGSDASTNTSIWKRIEIYAPNQMKVQVKQIKVEEGEITTPWCPNSSDMGSNATVEYDCSGFCNNGTRVGNITWSTDTPKYQVSTNFPNNCNTYIFNTEVPKLTKDLTFACWCKVASIGTSYSFIVSQGRDNTASGFNLALLNSIFILRGSFGTVDSNIATDNTWTHVVGTYDGTAIKIYINGELKNSLSYTADLTYTDVPAFVVGKMAFNYTSSTYYFPTNGNISDVRVYATALSAEDIQALYQAKNIPD